MLGRRASKRELPSTAFNSSYLKGVFEEKKYGKTKAEREYARARGPPNYIFDAPNTMELFKSEHPVQMSLDTYRAVMNKANSFAPMTFVKSEQQINKTGEVHGAKAHLDLVSKLKSPPTIKAKRNYKTQRQMVQDCLKEHEATWEQEFQAALAKQRAREVRPKAQKILDLKKKRAEIMDQLLQNDTDLTDLQRRRREKKLRPKRGPKGNAIARRFQTANGSLIFKHDGGHRRRAQTAVTKFRFNKTFNTTYADRLARERIISRNNF